MLSDDPKIIIFRFIFSLLMFIITSLIYDIMSSKIFGEQKKESKKSKKVR